MPSNTRRCPRWGEARTDRAALNGIRAVVAGGGVGGLAAGVALRHVGVDATVYERSSAGSGYGGGLKLWTNATRALKALGCGAAILGAGAPIERVQFCNRAGRSLADWDVGALGREHGMPTMGVRRPALQRLLTDALGEGAVRYGAEVESFEQDGDGVTVRFADGGSERADLLIAADGLHSVVRAQLGRPEPLRYAGYFAWRCVVRAPAGAVPANVFRLYWGRGARFVFYPVGDGQVYFDAMANGPDPPDLASSEHKPALRECYRGFGDPVEAIVEAAAEGDIARTPIYDRRAAKAWGKGRVTLLGDAAHPMTPNQGQGAGSSLEDAVVLANMLAEAAGPEAALREYERRRRKRTAEFVAVSRALGAASRWENPLTCLLRNGFMSGMYRTIAWRKEEQHVGYELGPGPLTA